MATSGSPRRRATRSGVSRPAGPSPSSPCPRPVGPRVAASQTASRPGPMATCGSPCPLGIASGASPPVAAPPCSPCQGPVRTDLAATLRASRPARMVTSGSPRTGGTRLGASPHSSAWGQAAAAELRAGASLVGLALLPRPGGCFTCEGGVTVSPSDWIVLIARHFGHSTCAIETLPSDLATAQSRPKTSTRLLALFASTAFRRLDRALEHARRRAFPSSLAQQWKQWKRQASPGAFRSSGHPALARSTNSHHC